MTPNGERLKRLRHALGISVNNMGGLLGLAGSGSGDKVREIERGVRDATGPMLKLMRYMEQAADIESLAEDSDAFYAILPKWLDCSDLEDYEGANAVEVVIHTRYPRFYALMMPEKLDEDQRIMLDDAGIAVVGLPIELGLTDLVVLWIDEPANDTKPLLEECARLKMKQALADLSQS